MKKTQRHKPNLYKENVRQEEIISAKLVMLALEGVFKQLIEMTTEE